MSTAGVVTLEHPTYDDGARDQIATAGLENRPTTLADLIQGSDTWTFVRGRPAMPIYQPGRC